MSSLFGLSETAVLTPFGPREDIINDNAITFGNNIQQ